MNDNFIKNLKFGLVTTIIEEIAKIINLPIFNIQQISIIIFIFQKII